MFLGPRMRVAASWAAGVMILMLAVTLLLMIGDHLTPGQPGLGGLGRVLIKIAILVFVPMPWISPWFEWIEPSLPAPGASLADIGTSVPFLLTVSLGVIGGILINKAQIGLSYIRKAKEAYRVATLLGEVPGARNQQTIGTISAGGDVNVKQIAESQRRLDDWTKGFWSGPFGMIVLSVVAIIVAAFATNLTGLTH